MGLKGLRLDSQLVIYQKVLSGRRSLVEGYRSHLTDNDINTVDREIFIVKIFS